MFPFLRDREDLTGYILTCQDITERLVKSLVILSSYNDVKITSNHEDLWLRDYKQLAKEDLTTLLALKWRIEDNDLMFQYA